MYEMELCEAQGGLLSSCQKLTCWNSDKHVRVQALCVLGLPSEQLPEAERIDAVL